MRSRSRCIRRWSTRSTTRPATIAVRAVGIFGGNDFTAGNDLGDFLAAGVLATSPDDLPVVKLLRALIAFPKPLLAGVKGVAIGIGTTMLMHCDAVVAGRSARFALPFMRLGLVPEAASSVLFPLIAGRTRASWLMLSGEQFGADEAKEMGLDEPRDGRRRRRRRGLADVRAARGTAAEGAMANTKRLLKAQFADQIDRAMDEELGASSRRTPIRRSPRRFYEILSAIARQCSAASRLRSKLPAEASKDGAQA